MPTFDIQIRRAAAADSASLMVLEKQSPSAAHWPESFYSGLFEDGGISRILLVAEEHSEEQSVVRGFLVARVIADECELENIVVGPDVQRRGLGSKLITALIEAARNQQAKRIFLEVRESNTKARSFYESCGFSLAGSRKRYYSDPLEDAILYTLAM